jgi:general secretion pathway protein A
VYYHHFGLSGPPFQFTPTADALYFSREHREALAFLEWSVLQEPTGFAVLIGESGVGKTTLVCSVIARYSGSVDTALVTNPRLNFEQRIALVLSQLAVVAGGLTKFEMIQRFMQLLEDRAAESCVAIRKYSSPPGVRKRH